MKSIFYIFILTLLTSCSATWHLNKAVKKDPSIIKTEVKDTIIKVSPRIAGSIEIVKDTVIKDGILKLSIKKDTIRKIAILTWDVDSVSVKVPVKTTKVTPPKTRLDKKQDFKIEKAKVKAEAIVKKAEAKSKTPAKKNTPWYFAFGILLIMLLYVVYLFYKNFKEDQKPQ